MAKLEKKVLDILNREKENHPYEYNFLMTPNKDEQLRDRFTRSMLINSVWYGGSDLALKQLYERDLKAIKIGNLTSDELNYFWAQSTEGLNTRKVHSGIPQLISEKMVDLLLSNGYETTMYIDNDKVDRDEENEERLFAILNDNQFNILLQEAIETESWSGGVAIKLSSNKNFKYPIIEIIQPEEYEPKIVAGRIVEDTFIKYFQRKNGLYKLKEKYGVDDKGGYIRYGLEFNSNGIWIDVPITDLEETSKLKDITFNGIYKKFSIYKPNKLPNSEFRGSKLGESDYSGSHGLFDAIDEVVSTMVQEFRDGKIKNFWPSALLPVDPITNRQYIPPSLKKDFITYQSGIGQDNQPTKPELIQGDLHSDKYVETYKKLLEAVLNNAGLSPQTIGVTGLESVSASEGSQELREKTSIRTRERKVDLWTYTLNTVFELVLILDDIKNNVKPREYIINVNFNDYKIQTLQDKTAIASQGLQSGAWDIKTAVEYQFPEKTEEEQILTRINIKIEKGINAFTKEEEEIYKKYVMDITEENTQPIVEEPPQIDETQIEQ